MGDHAQIIVRLDPLPPGEADRLAALLANWLCGLGIIRPYNGPDEDHWRTDWSPGPWWNSAVEDPDDDLSGYCGVDIRGNLTFVSAMGAAEPWLCGACGCETDDMQVVSDLLDAWLETGTEPPATCVRCGWTALLGDWPTQAPLGLVGAPAISFHGWPPLKPEFRDEIIQRLYGTRCRAFWQKI